MVCKTFVVHVCFSLDFSPFTALGYDRTGFSRQVLLTKSRVLNDIIIKNNIDYILSSFKPTKFLIFFCLSLTGLFQWHLLRSYSTLFGVFHQIRGYFFYLSTKAPQVLRAPGWEVKGEGESNVQMSHMCDISDQSLICHHAVNLCSDKSQKKKKA